MNNLSPGNKKRYGFTPLSNLSQVDLWIINRLKKENSVALTILAEEYSKERKISKRSARKVLERHLKSLIQEGIVERLDTYPIQYKLKRLPIKLLPSSFRLNDRFDLSSSNHFAETLGKIANPKQKIEKLRKAGLRVITKANGFRQRALLTAQYKHSIRPGIREYSDISFLFEENIKTWNNSVLAFENDDEEFMIMPVKTRFTDKKKVSFQLKKSTLALKRAFKKYKDAIMITLTLPPVFPLVIPVKEGEKVIGYIPLQDSIITQLKKEMMAWIRKNWKNTEVKMFTAYEYHNDYRLHLHILVFGIPYLIDWERRYGRKGEDAITYYSRKYHIQVKSKKKSKVSKYIFTALLDMWLQKILVRFSSVLGVNLLEAYINYKKKERLEGPINEIHRIRDGKWVNPPKDAFRYYSSGACYRDVVTPDRYVTKYVTKILDSLSNGGGLGGEGDNSAKIVGYWLFGKRFNSYSRSLGFPFKRSESHYWHYVGTFNILDLPDYILDNVIIDLT